MISGVQGMTQINQDATEAYTIAGVAANTFQLVGMDSTGFGVYSGGGQAIQVFNQVTGLSYLIGQTINGGGRQGPYPSADSGYGRRDQPSLLCQSDHYRNPLRSEIQPTNPVLASHGSTTRST